MEPLHANARDQFFMAIRTLAASPDTIQTRVTDASKAILQITIDEFEGDAELKIRFARLLDLIAVDEGELEKVAGETAAHMTDFEAMKVADSMCDFFYDLT
jgi:ubiquinone biosynthesis protein UbiJ